MKAVTFDLYGTLLANNPWKAEVAAVAAEAARQGVAVDAEAFLSACIAHAASRTASMRFSRTLLTAGAAEALRAQGAAADPAPFGEALHAIMASLPLFPDVREALDRCAHLPLAVVSNSRDEDLRQILAATGILPRFRVVVSAERAGAYKPAPEPFRLALAELGVAPQEVVHVGDSLEDDVGGAGAVGMRTAWVNRSGGLRPPGSRAPDGEGRTLLEALAAAGVTFPN